MTKQQDIAEGILHEVPADMRKVLSSDSGLLARWNCLTPIQRNEWICWITIVKKQETRIDHIDRMIAEIKEGKRQPCCWPGCPHRRPKAAKYFGKQREIASSLNSEIESYNSKLAGADREICVKLAQTISQHLPKAESKVWHRHPVWFIGENPIVGYSKQKRGIRLMFWSGASFDEEKLEPGTGKFKDASIFYDDSADVNLTELKRWLKKAEKIQWDYKNIVKRKGKLVRLN